MITVYTSILYLNQHWFLCGPSTHVQAAHLTVTRARILFSDICHPSTCKHHAWSVQIILFCHPTRASITPEVCKLYYSVIQHVQVSRLKCANYTILSSKHVQASRLTVTVCKYYSSSSWSWSWCGLIKSDTLTGPNLGYELSLADNCMFPVLSCSSRW